MLIVNADDLGASRSATDAISAGVEGGSVSSVSALVWMPDSERAAAIAVERGFEVGLHLNLTLPFGADDVPADVARRQAGLTELFGNESWWRGSVPDAEPADVEAALADQLDRFRATFGEPAFINGHHHIHLTDVVLGVLPVDLPIRQVPTTPGQLGRFDKRMKHVRERFRAPWATVDIAAVHPLLGGSGYEALREYANQLVEIVAHPHMGQADALRDPAWLELLAELGLTNYAAGVTS